MKTNKKHSFERKRLSFQSPSPVCMFYFAHPFGGIATPSTITYSIDPHRDIPVKASNASISKSKNLSWCKRRNSFISSSTATTQSQSVETHFPRTFQPNKYDEFTNSLIQALQQRFGKFFNSSSVRNFRVSFDNKKYKTKETKRNVTQVN